MKFYQFVRLFGACFSHVFGANITSLFPFIQVFMDSIPVFLVYLLKRENV